MSVKLRQRANDDGMTSPFLVSYNRETKKRSYEFLPNLKLGPSTNRSPSGHGKKKIA